MSTPALGIVEIIRSMLARLSQRLNITCQRIYKFPKVTHLQWPVVHLLVDIQVHIAVPWCINTICPYTLKVRR
jgi:hypothetical protein